MTDGLCNITLTCGIHSKWVFAAVNIAAANICCFVHGQVAEANSPVAQANGVQSQLPLT